MNSKRPATISIKDLSAAVDRAVKVVAEKNKVQFASIGPTISGKTVRGITEIAQQNRLPAHLPGNCPPGRMRPHQALPEPNLQC
jgi:hypothetical protein